MELKKSEPHSISFFLYVIKKSRKNQKRQEFTTLYLLQLVFLLIIQNKGEFFTLAMPPNNLDHMN